ncbi:MAG: tetratricopeptide repeat protein, partial [Anaerolineaceae bacterium]
MNKKGFLVSIPGIVLLFLLVSCSPSAEEYEKQGRDYVDAGEFEQAIEAFQNAVEADPGYADAYNNLGNTYRKTGQHDQALANLDKAIQLNPNHYKAYKNRGKLFAAQGEIDKALAD